MNNRNKSLSTESIFPIIVASLSILNIAVNYRNPLVLTNLVSLVGIAGTILYFRNISVFKKLIFFWIFVQVIIIQKETMDFATKTWMYDSYWDMAQFLRIKFGFYVSTETSKYNIHVNIIAFLYFALLKILEVSGLIGKKLTFKKFRDDNRLGDVFPLTGTVLKRVTLTNEKDWLLVQIESSFIYNDKEIEYVLIKSKDGNTLKQKAKGQLAYFRLVYSIKDIIGDINDIDNFPFIDWVICE